MIKHRIQLKLLFFFFFISTISVAPLFSDDSNTETLIKQIRKEFSEIENNSYVKIPFFLDDNANWLKDGGDNEVQELDWYEQANICIDSSGIIRKLEIRVEEIGESTQRDEYFNREGTLFFVYARQVMGGSGNCWEARLYFHEGIIIKNIADSYYLEQMKEYSPVTDGQYRNPETLGYHLNTEKIKKEFKINNEMLIQALAEEAIDYKKLSETQKWLAGIGKNYRVESLPYVTTLDLSRVEMDDEETIHLKTLKRLQWLSLRRTYLNTDKTALIKKKLTITDNGLADIASLINLRTLYLNDTDITDSGLVHLKKMTALEELDLSNTNITDKGVENFRNLKNLKHLTLYGTKITENGLKNLRKMLPQCEIYLFGV